MNAKQRIDLLSFLFWARRRCYAGGAKGQKLLREGEQFEIGRNEFSYWDTFWGIDPFIGQEMVWSGKIGWIWGMNYYGTMLAGIKDVSIEGTYMFLRSALLKCDAVAPYRGPKSYTEGEWVYENDWAPWSLIVRFSGAERIFYKGRMVYQGQYHGGVIGRR